MISSARITLANIGPLTKRSSRRPVEASAIVAFVSDQHNHAKVQHHLQSEHRVVIAERCGRLRASPHFYNDEADLEALLDALTSA